MSGLSAENGRHPHKGNFRPSPASLNRSNFKKYDRSAAVTAFKEFEHRTHLIVAEEGWEEVADFALDWAEQQIAA